MAPDLAEKPYPVHRYTLDFYLLLLLVVLPLWSLVPLSWGFVLFSVYTGSYWQHSWTRCAFVLAALCEVVFSAYYYYLSCRQAAPSPLGPGKQHEIKLAYTRLLKTGLADLPEDGHDEESMNGPRAGSPAEPIVHLDQDDPRAIDFRHCLRTWFFKAPWSSIRLAEFRKWLYWAMFNADLPPTDQIPHSYRTALDEALDLLQKRCGITLEEGSNPETEFIRLSRDPLKTSFRPLLLYVLVYCVNRYLRRTFRHKYNLRYTLHNGLECLIRIPENWTVSTGARPLVFIHGLGLGLLQYTLPLSQLITSFPTRPILILLQPQISQDFFHPQYLKPIPRDEMTDSLASLLIDLGWVDKLKQDSPDSDDDDAPPNKGVTMLSHSNGSVTHAWMLKSHPRMITHSCFVDPVTFCLWEGDVCYNFVYKPCRTGIELIMRYFVSTELGVANCLQRHFDWASSSLFFEEIPNARDPARALFLLGGKDDILHAERVKRYLTSHGVREGLWYDPEARHGQALMTGTPGFQHIKNWLASH
ncbi:hypothetical protein BDN72DRAFT_785882 [Pluteus cervinus]|uniref:Uncharacterized protein n=1 Tax=Pluteus cervinus TaxID=181527 RepID=A0ACD3BD22_9AGAR|nr:hypothetical protein BDN72DRAFT_785882 [Pluteus cervinus]